MMEFDVMAKPPRGVRVRRTAESLCIGRRHGMIYHFVAAPIAVVCLAIAARDLGNSQATLATFATLLFGIAAGYYGLIGILNRRRLRLDRGALQIADGPLPAIGNRRARYPALSSVSFTSNSVQGYRSRTYYYIVEGRLADGRTIIVDRVPEVEGQAQFIVQAIQTFLGQRD